MGPSHQTHLIKTMTPGERKGGQPDLLHDRTNHKHTRVLDTLPFIYTVHAAARTHTHTLSLSERNSLPNTAASHSRVVLGE